MKDHTRRQAARYTSRTVDKPNIVSAPMHGVHVILVREGRSFIVRAFTGISAFAFNTEVTRVCNVPFPYLHLAYPRQAQGVAVRREQRVPAKLITAAGVAGAAEPIAAQVTDISASGALLDCAGVIAPMDVTLRLSFRVKVGAEDTLFACAAAVRTVRTEEAGGGVRHGMEFTDMAQNDRLLLRSLIYQQLALGKPLTG